MSETTKHTNPATTAAQAFKNALPFNPEDFVQMDTWRKMADEGLNRYVGWLDEMAKLQRNSYDQLTKALEERNRAMNESIAYAQKLATEWNKMAMDATKRVADMVKPQN